MKPASWVPGLSLRYLFPERRGGSGSSSAMNVMTILAMLLLMLGTAVLIVVIGVMNGFQTGFIDSIIEISSWHARVSEAEPGMGRATGEMTARDALSLASASPDFRVAVAFHDSQAMLRSTVASAGIVNVRAIESLSKDKGLLSRLKLRSGGDGAIAPGRVAIGSQLALAIAVEEGSVVELVGARIDPEEGLVTERRPFVVGAVFDSGYFDFDRNLCFISLEDGYAMEGKGMPLSWGIKLSDRNASDRYLSRLASAPGAKNFKVESWKDYNRAFFGALRMEKSVMMLLNLLIFSVISILVYFLLWRSIHEQREEIATLKAIGASPSSVQAVFMMQGFVIGFIGSLLGLILGLWISVNINPIFGFFAQISRLVAAFTSGEAAGGDYRIFSSEVYYLTKVPVSIHFPELVFMFLSGTCISGIASFFASRKILYIKPMEVLRCE